MKLSNNTAKAVRAMRANQFLTSKQGMTWLASVEMCKTEYAGLTAQERIAKYFDGILAKVEQKGV